MTDFVQSFFQELNQKLPNAAKLFPTQEVQAMLQAALRKMDLVTREEFDAQSAVLARTRARLESMEVLLQDLKKEKDSIDAGTPAP